MMRSGFGLNQQIELLFLTQILSCYVHENNKKLFDIETQQGVSGVVDRPGSAHNDTEYHGNINNFICHLRYRVTPILQKDTHVDGHIGLYLRAMCIHTYRQVRTARPSHTVLPIYLDISKHAVCYYIFNEGLKMPCLTLCGYHIK